MGSQSESNGYLNNEDVEILIRSDLNETDELPSEADPDEILEIPSNESLPTWIKRMIGIALALVSGLLFTMNGFVIKKFDLDVIDALLVRSILQACIIGGIMKWKRIDIYPDLSPSNQFFLLFQGFVGASMIVTSFLSILMMPMGDAIALIFCTPVFTAGLTWLFHGNRLRLWKIFFILALLVGAVLVIQPPFMFGQPLHRNETDGVPGFATNNDVLHPQLYYLGVLGAFCTALLGGTYMTVISGPMKKMSRPTLLFYIAIAGVFVSLLTCVYHKDGLLSSNILKLNWFKLVLLIIIGFSGIMAYYCLVECVHYIDPVVASAIRSLEIVFGFIAQTILRNTMPEWISVLGAVVVMMSVIMIALEKPIVAKTPDCLKRIL